MEKNPLMLTTYISAAAICLAYEHRPEDEYSEIWKDLRRVIVRAAADYQHSGKHNEDIYRLCQTIIENG